MVTALAHDEDKEILYHVMPNTWRKKMTKQRYKYIGRSIQQMPTFLKKKVENLETPAPPPAVRSLHGKRRKDLQETESCDI